MRNGKEETEDPYQNPRRESKAEEGARLLLSALSKEARRRGHSTSELAAAIGVHPAHWYRLRAHPAYLARCGRETLKSIARYLDWPLGRVLLGSSSIDLDDFEIVLGGREAVRTALAQIEEGAFGTGLRTPLYKAARDHQLLIAELFFELLARTARGEREGRPERGQ